ncbi:MAG: hypothetical protein ABIY52_05485 [Gemmatimonadaceae bacterium]
MIMRTLTRAAVIAVLCAAPALHAQDKAKKPKKEAKPDSLKTPGAKADSLKPPPLFTSEKPLVVTFTTNVKQLRDDKGDTSPYRAATMTYTGDDGKPVVVPMRAKTHGIWRLKHCDFPPVRLNISNKDAKGTVFHDAEKPKFVSTCKDRDSYEQLVLQEMQLYRIYQLLTPVSHRVRTLRVSYADSASGKVEATRYGFIFEDPDKLADRFNGKMLKTKGAGPDDLDPEQSGLVYLFQYLIGNTDFSFNGLHNGEMILRPDGSPLLPVAYDFDFSGAVNAPYATVDPRLAVKRVRDRLFRGYCAHSAELPLAAGKFLAKKDAIYALYHDDLGKLMDERVVRETLAWYDDFFDAISTPRKLEQTVTSQCVGNRNK